MALTAAARASAVQRFTEAARRTLDPACPALGPITVAQAILESNYGASGLSVRHNNFFGMKAGRSWAGPVAVMDTTENLGPKKVAVRVKDGFRSYASMDASFLDHAGLFKRNPKTYAAALRHPNDPVAFAHALTGVYATDPIYGSKLVRVMRQHGLLGAFGFGPGAATDVVPRTARGVAPVAVLLLAVGLFAFRRSLALVA